MSRKTTQGYRDIFASCSGDKDRFGRVYDSMCKHQNYKNLSIGAKQFYTLCRVQSASVQGKTCLYKHGEEYKITYTERDFVFPASHLKMYGIDRSNANRYFKELIEAGFIDKKESNKPIKKVNVYSFSSRWQHSS